jgi:glyoxylase-like metal-dependent hydrolase (beta-lactamase superfamily II)
MNITVITTPVVLTFSVNCLLVENVDEYFLIDTGPTKNRTMIEEHIKEAGCQPGKLKSILLTHGDFDHTGNAAYFRKVFRSKIAMHHADLGMVEFGDMFWNRSQPNVVIRRLLRRLIKLRQSDRFLPDHYIENDQNLSEIEFPGHAISIPGHSKGSVGFLTQDGDFFCGDLLANIRKPGVWAIIDDQAAAKESVRRLLGIDIANVYPGHGNPFPMSAFKANTFFESPELER